MRDYGSSVRILPERSSKHDAQSSQGSPHSERQWFNRSPLCLTTHLYIWPQLDHDFVNEQCTGPSCSADMLSPTALHANVHDAEPHHIATFRLSFAPSCMLSGSMQWRKREREREGKQKRVNECVEISFSCNAVDAVDDVLLQHGDPLHLPLARSPHSLLISSLASVTPSSHFPRACNLADTRFSCPLSPWPRVSHLSP